MEAANGDAQAAAALRTFADVNYASPIDARQAPELSPRIAGFWQAWNSGSLSSASNAIDDLRSAFASIRDARDVLDTRLQDRELLAEASPWLDAAAIWARADLAALDMLIAARGGDVQGDRQTVQDLAAQAKAATFVEYGTAEPLAVGAGVLDKFVADALAAL